jgi:capsular polysaccharide export protein
MIVYLAEWTAKKDSLFRSVAEGAAMPPRRLLTIGLSFRSFAQSHVRTGEALAVAKRKPKGKLGTYLKYRLIWAQYNWSRRYFAKHPDAIALCWNGMTGSRRVFMQGAQDAGAARLYAELAPFPDRITLDPQGVNAANTLPREASFYVEWAAEQSTLNDEAWRALGANLTARNSKRSDVGQASGADLSTQGPFLFVPLQVPNDSQITLFGGWTQSVAGMIEVVAKAATHLPDGWHIRIKEHPSAKVSMASELAQAIVQSAGRIVVDNATDTFELVAQSRGVVTINSSVGLQAFFYDKPVVVLGEAFFALPGLTQIARCELELADVFSQAKRLSFEPHLRAAFMSYLDQVYYPQSNTAVDGSVSISTQDAQSKVAAAMAVGAAPQA